MERVNEQGRVAAFFDLDGTVVAPPSLEFQFVAYLARRGELRAPAAFRWLGVFLKGGIRGLFGGGWASVRLRTVDDNKLYLGGVPEQKARNWGEEKNATIECYPQALERITWHREHGHAIFLVSGTIAPLARVVAARLRREGEIGIAATELESYAGQWTGRTAGAAVCGPGKAHAIRELAARHNLDLARSYAYGDSIADRWMLGLVGNATVVNPGARLMWLARRRGWRIARWRQPEQGVEISRDTSGRPFATSEKTQWE
jgi:HAD superfamily hydrolase (TIGR01490 family)